MSDLISRKALLKEFEEMKSISKSLMEVMFFDAVMAMVDNQSTAYDVDEVVKELKSEADRWRDSAVEFNDDKECGHANGLEQAIDIVKGAIKDE